MKFSHYSLCLFMLMSPWTHAKDGNQQNIQTNRYSYTATEPNTFQTHLLSVVVTIQFPVSIKTIGEALVFLLSQSGYRLEASGSAYDEQYYLYMLMLPETQRSFHTVTLKSILDVLGNESYQLHVNPVKRTIRYQLKEGYKAYISHDDIALAKSQWEAKKAAPQYKQPPLTHTPHVPTLSPMGYGPVVRGESLSGIVSSLHNYDANPEKIMVAIYLKNPNAFLDQNINLLLEGQTLHLPSVSFIQSISSAQATQLIALHAQRWQAIQNDTSSLDVDE